MCKQQGDRQLGCKACSNALVWCSHRRDQCTESVGNAEGDSDGVATPKANTAQSVIRTPTMTDDDAVYRVMQELDSGGKHKHKREQGEGSEAASARGIPRMVTMANPM